MKIKIRRPYGWQIKLMTVDSSLNCVMLIDDDPDDNFLHQLVIQDTGLNPEVLVAESGEQALSYFSGQREFRKPDIIFLDINMPGMSGFDFLEKFKSLPATYHDGTKVVVLSTSSLPKDQQKASSIWKDVFYRTKPLTEQIILEILAAR